MGTALSVTLAIFSACTSFGAGSEGEVGPRDSGTDASAPKGQGEDAAVAADAAVTPACNPTARFGAPTVVRGLGIGCTHPTLSADELELICQGQLPNEAGLWTARRAGRTDAFGQRMRIRGLEQVQGGDPTLTRDGRSLFYTMSGALFRSDRDSLIGDFGPPRPVLLGDAGAGAIQDPNVLIDRSAMYFGTANPGRLWRAPAFTDGFGAPEPLGVGTNPLYALPTADEQFLYFGDQADGRVYRATRVSPTTSAYAGAEVVDELDALGADGGLGRPAWLSADGCRLYVVGGPGANSTIFMAERTP